MSKECEKHVKIYFKKCQKMKKSWAGEPRAREFAVYLLSDPNGPPTAFLLSRPQCTVGVLAGTHRGALRCPSKMASGTKRNPYLLHCCCTAEPVLTLATKHSPSVKHTCRGFWSTWIAQTTNSLCHFYAVHDFLMYSASPSTTMITFSSSSLFFSSSSPRSDPSFVVDSRFLPPHSMGMTVTGSSSWDRNVGDFFNDALGNAFLWNQLGHLSNLIVVNGLVLLHLQVQRV